MKKNISLLMCVMMAVCCLGLTACYQPSSEVSFAKDKKYKELIASGMSSVEAHEWLNEHEDQWNPHKMKDQTEQPTKEPIDFMEAICGTYLVSGTGVMTGGAVYDDEGPETTFTKLALHVSQAGDNAVQIDVEGDHTGSGAVSAESPTVSYTDSMGYEVTVTFTVKDGTSHVDMKIFGDLSIADTGEHCTETVILSGEK